MLKGETVVGKMSRLRDERKEQGIKEVLERRLDHR